MLCWLLWHGIQPYLASLRSPLQAWPLLLGGQYGAATLSCWYLLASAWGGNNRQLHSVRSWILLSHIWQWRPKLYTMRPWHVQQHNARDYMRFVRARRLLRQRWSRKCEHDL